MWGASPLLFWFACPWWLVMFSIFSHICHPFICFLTVSIQVLCPFSKRLFIYLLLSCMCCAKSLQSCPSLCNPMDCSLPGLAVHGIIQARILQWVARIPPGDHPDPVFEPTSLRSPALAGRFFTTSTTWEAHWVIWVPCIFEH